MNDFFQKWDQKHWLTAGAVLLLLLGLLFFSFFRGDTPNQPPAARPEPEGGVFRPQPVDLSGRLRPFFGEERTLNVYINQAKESREMKFEEYLTGVVAGEVGPEAPLEAAAAQAILARTFTLDQISGKDNPCSKFDADVCTDPGSFQAYAAEKITSTIREAVKSTRGLVLLYKGDTIFALYSSHAGGKTATKEESFPELKRELPYLRSVESPDDASASAEQKTWELRLPLGELARRLELSPKSVTQIEIAGKGPSGRALTINFGGASMHAAKVRQLVGPDEFRSTLLTSAKIEENTAVFAGRGWGHGAGLSQWGAITLANQGKKAADIVRHYYPTTGLAKLWE